MKGILYVAYGNEEYIKQASESAKSIKEKNNNLQTAIVTDHTINSNIWDHKIYKDIKRKPNSSRWQEEAHIDKLEGLLLSPFEKTLYLDSDTYCLSNIEDVFKILDRVDIGLTHDESRTLVDYRARGKELPQGTIGKTQKILPDSFPESFAPINGGFYLYNRSIFKFWEQVIEKYKEIGHHDEQAIVRLCLWESNLSYHIFPKEYNFSTDKHYDLFKNGAVRKFQMAVPKIFHYSRNKKNYKNFINKWEADLKREGYLEQTDVVQGDREVHIATIHWGSKWLNLQLDRIFKNNPNVKIWGLIDNVSNEEIAKHKNRFHFISKTGIRDHATKLDMLTSIILQQAKDEDIIIWLDGDAFPIGNLKRYYEETIEGKGYEMGAIAREENGDHSPHPCGCLSKVKFWKENQLSWKHGDIGSNYYKYYPDVGGYAKEQLGDSKTTTMWYPIRRSNQTNIHPLLFGVYDNIIYHHGAGSRAPCERCDRIDPQTNKLLDRNSPLVRKNIRKNQKISQRVYSELNNTSKEIEEILKEQTKSITDKNPPRVQEVQNRLVEAAKSRIGIKWEHNQESKRGIDCARLLRASATEAGIEPKEVENYPRVPKDRELLEELERYGLQEIPKTIRKPGDILVFRFQGVPAHVGILSQKSKNEEKMIHASALKGENRVIEIPLGGFYYRKLEAVYRISNATARKAEQKVPDRT